MTTPVEGTLVDGPGAAATTGTVVDAQMVATGTGGGSDGRLAVAPPAAQTAMGGSTTGGSTRTGGGMGAGGGGSYSSGWARLPPRDFEGGGVDLSGKGSENRPLREANDYNEKEKQSILATFNKWDQAGDGFITEAELTHVLKGLGVRSGQVKAIFQEVDKNRDNKIDYTEFVDWCYNGSARSSATTTSVKTAAKSIKYPLKLDYLDMELHRNKSWDWWSGNDLQPYIVLRHPLDKKKVQFTSPCGSEIRSQVALDKLKEPLILEFAPNEDVIAVDMYIYRTLRGSKFIGSGEIKLADIAPEVARGMGKTRRFVIAVYDEVQDPNTRQKRNEKTGQVVMCLVQPSKHEPWETLKVQYWKRDKLPTSTPSSSSGLGPWDVLHALDSLTACPDDRLEYEVFKLVESNALAHLRNVETRTVDTAEEVLNSVIDWLRKIEATAKTNTTLYQRNRDALNKTYSESVTQVLIAQTQGSNANFKMMKVCIKFALALDPGNRYLPEIGNTFRRYLNMPEDSSLQAVMDASEVDNSTLDCAKLGLVLESDAPAPPEISDDLRYRIRDHTVERVLNILGYQIARNDRRSMTVMYEAEGEKLMEDVNFQLPNFVTTLMSKVVYFCGEKPLEQMTIPEMILTRQRDPEALVGRFDVVALPTMAEYDKDWKPLVNPSTKRNIAFFGESPSQPVGGSGWFWILHAAAINIGETAHAEDFQEYSKEPDNAFKGSGGRWLDEDRYVKDMAALWLNCLLCAAHVGVQDFIAFPFGMGAFLRNLHKLDDRYLDDAMMRRLRLRTAAGLFDAIADVCVTSPTPRPMTVHVCLIDINGESRVNHNVFIEAAGNKVKEMPELAKLIKIHRNADCLHLANQLATRPPGPGDSDTAPRKVGMLNGANNKLLGNHWFSSGARNAIDENFHRRSAAMCVAGLLLNQATKPEKRGFTELVDNVQIFGATVVRALPPAGCGRRFIPNPPRRKAAASSGKFLPKVSVSPYGVLGSQYTRTGMTKDVAPQPTADMAIVDPAGLTFIQSRPGGAGGASGATYRWLGIDREPQFPDPVREGIKAATDAKFFNYPGKCICIHAVGPNFNEQRCQRDEAVQLLATTYKNILREFAGSGAKTLRCLPVSSSIFAGSFSDEMPEMTVEALEKGFSELDSDDQTKVLDAEKLEMCIFNEKEVEVYEELWSGGVRKRERRDAGRAGGSSYVPGAHGGRHGGGRHGGHRDRGSGHGWGGGSTWTGQRGGRP